MARALPEEQPLLKKVLPGAALIAASVVITVADQIYSAAAGEIFELGPLRATWIAALLLFAGLGLVVYRALPRE